MSIQAPSSASLLLLSSKMAAVCWILLLLLHSLTPANVQARSTIKTDGGFHYPSPPPPPTEQCPPPPTSRTPPLVSPPLCPPPPSPTPSPPPPTPSPPPPCPPPPPPPCPPPPPVSPPPPPPCPPPPVSYPPPPPSPRPPAPSCNVSMPPAPWKAPMSPPPSSCTSCLPCNKTQPPPPSPSPCKNCSSGCPSTWTPPPPSPPCGCDHSKPSPPPTSCSNCSTVPSPSRPACGCTDCRRPPVKRACVTGESDAKALKRILAVEQLLYRYYSHAAAVNDDTTVKILMSEFESQLKSQISVLTGLLEEDVGTLKLNVSSRVFNKIVHAAFGREVSPEFNVYNSSDSVLLAASLMAPLATQLSVASLSQLQGRDAMTAVAGATRVLAGQSAVVDLLVKQRMFRKVNGFTVGEFSTRLQELRKTLELLHTTGPFADRSFETSKVSSEADDKRSSTSESPERIMAVFSDLGLEP